MNTDCRQLSSWMGRVNHMPKLQAQRNLQSSVIMVHLCFIPPQFDLRRRCVTINLKATVCCEGSEGCRHQGLRLLQARYEYMTCHDHFKIKNARYSRCIHIPANCPYFDPPPQKKKRKKKKDEKWAILPCVPIFYKNLSVVMYTGNSGMSLYKICFLPFVPIS